MTQEQEPNIINCQRETYNIGDTLRSLPVSVSNYIPTNSIMIGVEAAKKLGIEPLAYKSIENIEKLHDEAIRELETSEDDLDDDSNQDLLKTYQENNSYE